VTQNGDIYYDATVKSAALAKTGTGKTQLAITFDPDLVEAKPITGYLFFTDAAIPQTEKALRNIGWDPLEHAWGIDEMVETDALVGMRASIVCGWEEYEGKSRLKVKFINELGGAGAVKEKLEPEEARAFTATLRQRLGFTGGATASSRREQGPPPPTDEDIPF